MAAITEGSCGTRPATSYYRGCGVGGRECMSGDEGADRDDLISHHEQIRACVCAALVLFQMELDK